VSGLGSWSNAEQTVGVSLFGSYQKRNFTNVSFQGKSRAVVA
jgi:hypothetical protein